MGNAMTPDDDDVIEFPPHPAPPSTRQRRSVIRPQMADGDHHDRRPTEEIPLPTPDSIAEQACRRAAQALLACDGVDMATLELLALRPQGGNTPTNLQILLTRVTWSALHAQT